MTASSSTARDTRWWDPLAAALLMCSLITASTRLAATKWTEDLYLVQNLAFLGVILGLALGYSQFKPKTVSFFALAYGIFLIPWQFSLTTPGNLEWKDRLLIILERLEGTFSLVFKHEPVNDNIFFLVLMACLFWILSVHSGYSLIRYGEPWRAVLPPGLALFVIHIYDPYIARRIWYLATYLFLALILVAWMTYVQGRIRWRQTRTHLPPDIGIDWLRFALFVVIVVILVSWTSPALARSLPAAQDVWQFIRHPWVNLQNRLENLFAALNPSAAIVHNYYGNSLSLGRGKILTETPVFSVEAPPRPAGVERYYWRAIAYDRYENGQWLNSINLVQRLIPEATSPIYPSYEGRAVITFTFQTYQAASTLYAAAQPESASIPVIANLGITQDNTVDLITIEAEPELDAGDSYQTRSSVSAVTEEQLRSASQEYPRWIREHYLQLPYNITPRTRDLAKRVAGGIDNSYDIAVAITRYLRAYEYADVIDARPPNQEVVDWWLFDYKKGFCQYYASAEVILLRSLGIPARLAIGYAQGKFTPNKPTEQTDQSQYVPESAYGGVFLVRQLDAHAWPEVYFTGYGWVEFEPTTSQTPLFRPSNADDLAGNEYPFPQEPRERGIGELDKLDPEPPQLPDGNPGFFTLYRSWIILISIFILVSGLSISIIFYRRHSLRLSGIHFPVLLERGFIRIGIKPPGFLKRWARYASLSRVEKAYLEINRALTLLGKRPSVDHTPAERASILEKLLPASSHVTQLLLVEYQLSMYSSKPANNLAARLAGEEIRKFAYQAYFQRLVPRWLEPSRKKHPDL